MGLMNRKGMFFTIIVIVLISILILSYTLYSQVETMSNFIVSMEKDLSRQLYVSGFRSIFVIEKSILENGQFISDLNASTIELFINGSFHGIPQTVMVGATFPDIVDSIKINSEKMGIDTSLSLISFEFLQTNPWSVEARAKILFEIKDNGNLAMWNKTETITTQILVEKFEDPLYSVSTNGWVSNNITRSSFTNFVSGNDITNLSAHALGSFYIASSDAPSFLDRLEGKMSPNVNGIESLVNLQKLSSQGLVIQDKSVVDYIYFSSSNPSKQHILGMPSWFKLDNSHLDTYQVSGIVG
jgi:hypothetical protein